MKKYFWLTILTIMALSGCNLNRKDTKNNNIIMDDIKGESTEVQVNFNIKGNINIKGSDWWMGDKKIDFDSKSICVINNVEENCISYEFKENDLVNVEGYEIDGKVMVKKLVKEDISVSPTTTVSSGCKNEYETVSGKDLSNLINKWLSIYKNKKSCKIDWLSDFKVIGIEKNMVTFDVKPVDMKKTNWLAGNGEIKNDGWIRGKLLFVETEEKDGLLKIKSIGTGP